MTQRVIEVPQDPPSEMQRPGHAQEYQCQPSVPRGRRQPHRSWKLG
eukprot:CAMPEP_0204429814 /NCGR_PEP_ID=MMETSP0470-20130426/61110_1 /ASSEMBLY_ACC=CAM_ASM_000385 /TAXON_ID=2969 /ORGANISM="Oxyrrhis marina" /LENGTH=45 /DNA_ID= /DNA_START= /DNA_END= /DNA_ORIENTATION=